MQSGMKLVAVLATILAIIALVSLLMMGGGMMGGGMMFGMLLFGGLIIVLVVALVLWMIKRTRRQ